VRRRIVANSDTACAEGIAVVAEGDGVVSARVAAAAYCGAELAVRHAEGATGDAVISEGGAAVARRHAAPAECECARTKGGAAEIAGQATDAKRGGPWCCRQRTGAHRRT